jgi:hypothetical protein
MPARPATGPVAVKLTAVAAFVLVTCAACGSAAAQPSLARCSAYGVRAIRRHVVVHALPAACAGLSREQVNSAVATAVRAAVGPLPKAAARSLAARDSKYLAPLTTPIPPPPPTPLSTAGAPSSSTTQLSLSALAFWVLTASAGSYLLVRTRAIRRRRAGPRARRTLGPIVAVHVGAAAACVATLAAFAVTGVHAVGWAAVGLVTIAAGFGMATLVNGLPEPGATSCAANTPTPTAARRQQSLVGVIALHGVLATVTILLVWLAVVSGS